MDTSTTRWNLMQFPSSVTNVLNGLPDETQYYARVMPHCGIYKRIVLVCIRRKWDGYVEILNTLSGWAR